MDHDRHRGRLTTQTSPTLREGLGIGADTAAEMLIICGDTPDRIHAEAAFATLCGACPIPASSGMTTGRHRLYRGGHRQANAALHRAVIVRMGVVARIVTGPHDAHRQDPHLSRRYDTGRPRAVIRLRIAQPRTTSLPCPAGLRARRPSPIMDVSRKHVCSTRP